MQQQEMIPQTFVKNQQTPPEDTRNQWDEKRSVISPVSS